MSMIERKAHYIVLSGIVALGAWLRLRQLGDSSLWVDEIGQVLASRNGPWAAVAGATTHFGAAPLDYIGTSIVHQFGDSEFVLRLPAAIWGTLSIVLVYWFATLVWRSVPVGLIAAFLLAITPTAIELSQEVRWYSFSMMFALLNGCLFFYALKTKKLVAWVLLGISFLLAVTTALFQVFVIAALGISLLFLWAWSRRAADTLYRVSGRDILYFAVTLILPASFALYWYTSGAMRHDTLNVFAFTPVPYAEFSTYPLFGAYSSFLHPWPIYRELTGPVVLPLLVVIGLGFAVFQRRVTTVAPALLVALTVAGVYTVDYVASYFFAYRQLLLVVPFYLCLAALGIWSLAQVIGRQPRGQAVVAVCLLAMLVWLIEPQLRAYYSYAKTNWRDTAALLTMAADHPANRIAIDPTWQPYVFYYGPDLQAQVADLPALAADTPAEGAARIWYLGPRDVLAAAVPPTWEISALVTEPVLPIFVAANQPAQEWLPSFARGPLPPIAYRYGLLYTLVALDRNLALEIGDELLKSVRDNSTRLNPRERAELTANIGRVMFDAGETEAGIDLMYEAVRYDDMSEEALNTLGYALTQTGELRQAAAIFQQSIWHNPRSYWAHAFLANIHDARQEWDHAAEFHIKAWELAYDPLMKTDQAAAVDAAFAQSGNEQGRAEFQRRVEEADSAAP